MLQSWQQWCAGVVVEIRHDLREVLEDVKDADIDWDAWRPFYEEGRSPRAAVDRAFLRDVQPSRPRLVCACDRCS